MKPEPKNPRSKGSLSPISDAILGYAEKHLGRVSLEFSGLRAKKGLAEVKRDTLKRIRELELDLDHLVILTHGKNPDPKYIESKQRSEEELKACVTRLREVCIAPKDTQ